VAVLTRLHVGYHASTAEEVATDPTDGNLKASIERLVLVIFSTDSQTIASVLHFCMQLQDQANINT
jgi:hypothetical protein